MTSFGPKIQKFKEDVAKHLAGQKGIVMATAWLASDNVIVDLFKKHTTVLPHVVGIDTLHLFPETLKVKNEMASKYDLQVREYKPKDCETLADFEKLHGKWSTQKDADFDFRSKIEPLQRAFKDLNKNIAVTGRRRDQGNERVELDVWEQDKNTFNPLADWSWSDIVDYVLTYDVPVNQLHKKVFISKSPIDPQNRNDSASWAVQTLPLPYFAYQQSYINSLGPYVYIWKSFGDIHTSSQVYYYDSERAGRFVGRANTECGIHTRIATGRTPHGGKLVDRMNPQHASMPYVHTVEMTERQVCDLELLINGGFSPLEGFMNEAEYLNVIHNHRLLEGQLFGIPITLDTDSEVIKVGDVLRLHSTEFGGDIGRIKVETKWIPDRRVESRGVYGTDDEEHPAVWHLLNEKKKYNIGGKVFGVMLPHRNWVTCKTPREIREQYKNRNSLVAFQCRNPIHRAHAAMFLEVSKEYDAEVLVHPIVGPTKSDDFSAKVRKITYDALNAKLTDIHFEYLPYNMMVGGPREALQHIIVRKNYGCTHMIVGRDHAGCKNKSGKDYYGPYDAQEFVMPLHEELGITMIPFKQMVYIPEKEHYFSNDEASKNGWKSASISGTEFRRRINKGEEVPHWFAFPEVVNILRQHYGPRTNGN